MAWIESHQELERHPKVADLMAAMGWNLDETIGKLHRFWWWCVDYAEDGDLRKHNDNRIAQAMGVATADAPRLVKAMVAACWLDRDPYFRVHDWWEYIGLFLQRKYGNKSPEKWQQIRELYSNCAEHCTPTVQQPVHQLAQPNLTLPRRERERETKFAETPPMPRKAFDELCKMRAVPQECADWFWNTHDGRNWTDATGQPIRKVEPLLLNALKNWQAKKAQGSFRNGKPQLKPDHEKGF